MFRSLIIPLLALAGLGFAIYTVRSENQPRPVAAPVAEPARSPFLSQVAGSGIIESANQNTAIGTHLPGIVAEVMVRPGMQVRTGDPLLRIDDRQFRAELAVRRAALEEAAANLARLEQLPRPEDVAPVQSRVDEAASLLDDLRMQYEKMRAVPDQRAVVQEDLDRRRFAVLTGEARLAAARAELAQIKAGAWKPDLEIARAKVESARALVRAAETDLERLVVRSPIDGAVLQCNVRVGEFAQAGALATPLLVVGRADVLWVRVDIDENDAWRLTPGAKARASLRGNADIFTDELTFVRVDPYVIPKRSLTGESTERVDTRVLQVIYAFPASSLKAYVGQLVDVRIDAPSDRPEKPVPAPAGTKSVG
ncbi:MAG: efflux RND transporter periplasmic adaptor subunit [Phycisphaeraceae bacterium]|nr:efflux RND transporter periplasmic adaptor subunit [Phycisphaeraceae bacterium]